MTEDNKLKKTLLPYFIFLTILACIGIFLHLRKEIINNNSSKPTKTITITQNDTIEYRNGIDDNTNIVNYSPLDFLLNEKQKLQDSLLMEVTGKNSEKAGYGPKAKVIQKQLEEIEKEIEILIKYNFDTLR